MAFEKGKCKLCFSHSACLKVLKITFLCLCVFTVTSLSVESSAFLCQPLAVNWYTSLLENLLCRDQNILALKVVGNVSHYYGSLSNSQSMWNADAAGALTLVLMAVHPNYPGAAAGEGVYFCSWGGTGTGCHMPQDQTSSLIPDMSVGLSDTRNLSLEESRSECWKETDGITIAHGGRITRLNFNSSHSGVNQAFLKSQGSAWIDLLLLQSLLCWAPNPLSPAVGFGTDHLPSPGLGCSCSRAWQGWCLSTGLGRTLTLSLQLLELHPHTGEAPENQLSSQKPLLEHCGIMCSFWNSPGFTKHSLDVLLPLILTLFLLFFFPTKAMQFPICKGDFHCTCLSITAQISLKFLHWGAKSQRSLKSLLHPDNWYPRFAVSKKAIPYFCYCIWIFLLI